MKHLLLTTIAAVVLVGCGESQQSVPAPEAKPVEPVAEAAQPEPTTAKAPDILIHEAAFQGDIDAVKQHLAAGTDVNKRRKKVLADGTNTPLDFANLSESDKRNEIVSLLKKGGGKVGDWFNAHESIHKAARGGNIKALKKHLAEGIDVNAKTILNETPLMKAAIAHDEHVEVVKLLISSGADVNVKDANSFNALGGALSRGHQEILKLLIAAGADVNAEVDKFGGATPLHIAAQDGYKEIAELLIAKGADVNAKDVNGVTPLDAAINDDVAEIEIADLLRKHGGKTGEELKTEGK